MEATNWREFITTRLIKFAGYSAIIIVTTIFIFLIREGAPAIVEIPLSNLFSERWYPIEGFYGILPLIGGSIVVTVGAAIFAIPLGICTAIYISEVAPHWAREILKPLVEVLAGIPSVLLGFLGIVVFAQVMRETFNLQTGLSAFTGAVLLGAISVPTIVSVAEDALDAVPKTYRDASLAMGATEWQTIWRVTLPSARSGVLTAIMLGIGRAIGETMTVMMVTGNAPVMPTSLSAILEPIRTMTATIAAEMGEVAGGSVHYHSLFFIGIVLFLISLVINLAAASIVFRERKRAERILS
ncbi:MAG: phosphate ABC transporter permease subunit PstC [Anaerolineales bacterium]|nr:phosphate ABC transporter permease subunit PstC [Anaerolineales bacterium]